ncbi:MAG TPA: hypothetical protein VGM03_23655, partial [Phycisphaerae bacterium]
SCQNPTPAAGWIIAADDFICPNNATIVRVCWYGVVSGPAQLNPPPAGQAPRRYLVRFYSNDPQICKPDVLLFTACVKPSNMMVSNDCLNRPVYRFSAPLPTPGFQVMANVHYWLQISEIDALSANQNVEDFRWSGYHPPGANHAFCPAAQHGAGGNFFCPIADDCPQPHEDDLAFCLFQQAIVIGGIMLPNPAVLAVDLINPGNGLLAQTLNGQTDDDGDLVLVPENLPDGSYHLRIRGMGMVPQMSMMPVSIADGTETASSFFDIFLELPLGDLDGDASVTLHDYAQLQNGFTGP